MKIVHNDIKPANFVYNNFSKTGILVDYGLCTINKQTNWDEVPTLKKFQKCLIKNIHHTNSKVTGHHLGTSAYLPPEKKLKLGDYGAEVDVWALGCIAIELFSERYPFGSKRKFYGRQKMSKNGGQLWGRVGVVDDDVIFQSLLLVNVLGVDRCQEGYKKLGFLVKYPKVYRKMLDGVDVTGNVLRYAFG